MSHRHSDIRSQYAKRILRDEITRRYNATHNRGMLGGELEPLPYRSFPNPNELRKGEPELPEGPVGIIGAGAAGLYLAMMLKDLGINCEIIEASERIGGRCFTYDFPTTTPAATHNYYDIGAMRLPFMTIMQPVFALIDKLNQAGFPVTLKPYTLNDPKNNEPNLFSFQSMSSEAISTALTPFKEAIVKLVEGLDIDFETGFKVLMKWDNMSTRQYLSTEKGMKFDAIQTLETFDTSTGLFNQAFSESVLDFFDFETAKEWYRVEGGMERLTDAMQAYLSSSTSSPSITIKTGCSVTALSDAGSSGITVTYTNKSTGAATSTTYNTVFNTTTLACLQQMDISGLNLNTSLLTGIRSLAYDRSCKVAIKFNQAWWAVPGGGIPNGGTSATDLPIRSVVYPSWNDGTTNPAVLIASYTWAQDADRMGSFIPRYSNSPEKNQAPTKDDPVLHIVLRNLAKVWSVKPNSPSYEDLLDMYVDHHAYAWQQDPNMGGGAFALFGPGQFSNMYPELQTGQCNNKFFIIGEAASAHHAWIVGALDSATTALYTYLAARKQFEKIVDLKATPMMGGGEGKEPAEMEEGVLLWKVELSGSPE